ncbi:MAG: riboflavin kinase [bacterium]
MKVRGIIIRGKGKGKKLGFPTANIALKKEIPSGVYEGSVHIKDKKYQAAIFVGKDKKILEAHLTGFFGDLYGKEITVEVLAKLRDIIHFDNDYDLIKQISKDIEKIKSPTHNL